MAMSGCIGRIHPPICRIGRRFLLSPTPPPRTGLQFLRRTPTLPPLRKPPPPLTTTTHNEAEAEVKDESSMLTMNNLFGVLSKNLGLIWWVLITLEAEKLKLKVELRFQRKKNKNLQAEYRELEFQKGRRNAYSKTVAAKLLCYSAWHSDPEMLVEDLPLFEKLIVGGMYAALALLTLKMTIEYIPPKLVMSGAVVLFVFNVANRMAQKFMLKDMFIPKMEDDKLRLENEISELETKNDVLRVEIRKGKKFAFGDDGSFRSRSRRRRWRNSGTHQMKT